jgi:hypothetical protein
VASWHCRLLLTNICRNSLKLLRISIRLDHVPLKLFKWFSSGRWRIEDHHVLWIILWKNGVPIMIEMTEWTKFTWSNLELKASFGSWHRFFRIHAPKELEQFLGRFLANNRTSHKSALCMHFYLHINRTFLSRKTISRQPMLIITITLPFFLKNYILFDVFPLQINHASHSVISRIGDKVNLKYKLWLRPTPN